MAIKNKEISKQLGDELRAASLSGTKKPADGSELHMVEPISPTEAEADQMPGAEDIIENQPAKPFTLNKRTVTLEYLDKFEQATIASTRYEAIKEFSQLVSNVSIVLLSLSIATFLVFYFINPDLISVTSLVILSLEAFTLLGLTLYSMLKASTYKHIRDISISDFSTCSQSIGNPRAETHIPPEISDMLNL